MERKAFFISSAATDSNMTRQDPLTYFINNNMSNIILLLTSS